MHQNGLTVIASSMSAITLTPYYSVVNASNGLWSDQISAIPVQSKPTIFSKTLPERGEQTEQMIFFDYPSCER